MAFLRRSSIGTPEEDRRAQTRTRADLLKGLTAADAKVRRWSARDLAGHPDVSQALAVRLGQEPDPSVREVIITSLIQKGDKEAVWGLADQLRSEDPALRNEAVLGLQQMPTEVAAIMEVLLDDPDPDVRIFAVNILESLRHPLVEHWLIHVIENDTHVNVCATALDLITEVGTAQAIPAIETAKRRFAAEPYIQYVANLALGRVSEG